MLLSSSFRNVVRSQRDGSSAETCCANRVSAEGYLQIATPIPFQERHHDVSFSMNANPVSLVDPIS